MASSGAPGQPGAGCPNCGSLLPPVAWTGEETCPACGYVWGPAIGGWEAYYDDRQAAAGAEGKAKSSSYPLRASAPSASLVPRGLPLQSRVTPYVTTRSHGHQYHWLHLLRVVACELGLAREYATAAFDRAERVAGAGRVSRTLHLYAAALLSGVRERKLPRRVDEVVGAFLPWATPGHPASVRLVMKDLYDYWPATARPAVHFKGVGTGDHPARRGYCEGGA